MQHASPGTSGPLPGAVRAALPGTGSLLGMVAAAATALVLIFAYAPAGTPPTRPVAVLASIGLVADDGHRGLFDVSGMTPGRAVVKCLRVRYDGPAPGGTVFVSATDLTGPLAAHLQVRVEQGTAPGAGTDCTGFSGAGVYDGTLTGLVDVDPAAPRTSTGWSPLIADERTYRITATLRDTSAQDQSSTATFRWFLVGAPAPTTSPPVPATPPTATPPTTSPPTAPVTTAPVTTAPVPTASAPPETADDADPFVAPVTSAAPTPAAAPATGLRASGGAPASSAGSRTVAPGRDGAATPAPAATESAAPRGAVAGVRKALADLGRNLTAVALRTTTHGPLPIVAIIVLLAFLALQNRIDRFGPARATATAADPYLTFVEPADALADPAAPDVAAVPGPDRQEGAHP